MLALRPATALALLAAPALAQWQPPPPASIRQNHPVGELPWDVVITPDGTKAILQTVQPDGLNATPPQGRTYVLDLESPYEVLWTSGTHAAGFGGTRIVAALNDHAIAAPFGTNTNGTTTASVRILKNLGTQPVVGEHAYGELGWDVAASTDDAGRAVGIVKYDCTTRLFDLDSPTSPPFHTTLEPVVGSTPPFTATYSQFMARAVATTSSRFLTAVNLTIPGGGGSVPQSEHGLVSIHDLRTGAMLAKHGFKCDPNGSCTSDPSSTGTKLQHLHDVTVTPDGQMGIVSGWGVIGVYKLYDGSELANYQDYMGNVASDTLPRQTFLSGAVTNRHTRRSVVASNDYAVVVGHDQKNYGNPSTDASMWRVAIVKLSGGTNIEMNTYTDTGGNPASPCYSPVATPPGRAHDVALSPNGKYAVVSVRQPETLVIPLLGSNAHQNAPLEYARTSTRFPTRTPPTTGSLRRSP